MANTDYIPLPFFDCQIKLHADSHYGDDDPTQWAQPYISYHCHFAAIPRPNTLVDHQIIWWTPIIGDFSCSPCSRPVSGLGKLCWPRYNELRTSFIFLRDHVKTYQQSTPSEQISPLIQPSVKWIEQVLDQLHSVQMSFRHIEFVVQDLQRVWLYVWAILDYMEIYKPCMDGHAPPGDIADTIGTFTTSICVAQDMFLAGLPCWLIWPSSKFGDNKIFSIGQIFDPRPATDAKKYRAIKNFACNFLCSQDPFEISCISLSLARASQPSSLSTPAVASSSTTQHLTGRDSQGAVRKPARSCGAGKSSVFDILIYYNIKLFLKVLINRPGIMGVINSS